MAHNPKLLRKIRRELEFRYSVDSKCLELKGFGCFFSRDSERGIQVEQRRLESMLRVLGFSISTQSGILRNPNHRTKLTMWMIFKKS